MNHNLHHGEIGRVHKAKRYLLTLTGLPSARVNDLIVNESGQRAIVRALDDTYVYALSLEGSAEPGDRYQFLKEQNLYTAGPELFGRVINTLGEPIDEQGSFSPPNLPLQLEVDAAGIEVRQHIHDQLETGVTLVDTLVPIAKGQRQLIFGPIRSGKTTFLTHTVLTQAALGTVCIYAVVGKPVNGLRKITDTILTEATADSKVLVVAALSDDPAPMVALAPSVAFALAEYYQRQGEDVLVILDDLYSHAKYLREVALLEGRLPSTESYPGDIFYQHAHLMERSGHFVPAVGGGSITTLPVIQTTLKNFSDLIPTNLMACTDGHLAFIPQLRAEGIYPSISFEQSVTRVGRQAQVTLQKEVTRRAQILLSSYRTQKEYAKFSADLSAHAKDVLARGAIVEEWLRQDMYETHSRVAQVVLLTLALSDFFIKKPTWHKKAAYDSLVELVKTDDRFAAVREKALDDTADWQSYLEAVEFAAHSLPEYV